MRVREVDSELGPKLESRCVLTHSTEKRKLLNLNTVARVTEFGSHKNLHVMDGVPISPSFKDRIGETQVDQVLDRFFPERMIDAEDGLVWEIGAKHAVERLRQGEVSPERFFHDHEGSGAATSGALSR
jgi:hypothetical protein